MAAWLNTVLKRARPAPLGCLGGCAGWLSSCNEPEDFKQLGGVRRGLLRRCVVHMWRRTSKSEPLASRDPIMGEAKAVGLLMKRSCVAVDKEK